MTVTAGHAFGGELEAVSLPSALDVAVRLGGADVVVVAMGPGVVGTGSRLGTSAVEVAPAVDAAAVLGGRPIVAARASEADPRERHRGLSHHTETALRLATHAAAVGHAQGTPSLPVAPPHQVITVEVPDVGAVLAAVGIDVTTMGRGPQDDPVFFSTTAAAAVLAANFHRQRATVRP